MIPTNFVRLEAFPLTATGKVNRLDLPNPGKSRPLLVTEYMTPRNDLERTLSQIWSEVLDLDEVEVRDNFLEDMVLLLGGQLASYPELLRSFG